MLESALARAAESLPDRGRFELDTKHWVEFEAALDAPPRSLSRLRRLLTKPSIVEARRK